MAEHGLRDLAQQIREVAERHPYYGQGQTIVIHCVDMLHLVALSREVQLNVLQLEDQLRGRLHPKEIHNLFLNELIKRGPLKIRHLVPLAVTIDPKITIRQVYNIIEHLTRTGRVDRVAKGTYIIKMRGTNE